MRSRNIAFHPSIERVAIALGLVVLPTAVACGGRAEPRTNDDDEISAPSRPPTNDDEGLFIPPQIPGVDRIAENLGVPSAIGLSEREVVFATRATVVQGELVKAGGLFVRPKLVGVPLLVSLDGRGAAYESVFVDGNDAFVGTSDGRIVLVPLRGGEERVVVEAEAGLTAVNVAGTHVYYATDKGAFFRAPRAGGKAQTLGSFASPVRAINVDGESIYVATANAIVRFTKDTPTKEVFTEVKAEAPCAMVRADRTLFWTDVSGKQEPVVRLALDTKDVRPLVSAPFSACAIAADAASVWFARKGLDSGLLMHAPVLGGEAVEVPGSTAALTGPGTVAIDATHVYWLTATAVLRSKK